MHWNRDSTKTSASLVNHYLIQPCTEWSCRIQDPTLPTVRRHFCSNHRGGECSAWYDSTQSRRQSRTQLGHHLIYECWLWWNLNLIRMSNRWFHLAQLPLWSPSPSHSCMVRCHKSLSLTWPCSSPLRISHIQTFQETCKNWSNDEISYSHDIMWKLQNSI